MVKYLDEVLAVQTAVEALVDDVLEDTALMAPLTVEELMDDTQQEEEEDDDDEFTFTALDMRPVRSIGRPLAQRYAVQALVYSMTDAV